MAQSLKSKISKLSQAYSITAIIDTAKEVQQEIADRAIWDAMSADQKTEWILSICRKYNLTPDQDETSIYINELPPGKNAYFVVFLPRKNQDWHLEIGGSYIDGKNGGIWTTAPGLVGKERQIEQVLRLHNIGE